MINSTEAGRRTVVGKIMSALPSSGVFILFLNIVVVVLAVVGMQFFGGHFHWPDGTSSRVNFDNFYQVQNDSRAAGYFVTTAIVILHAGDVKAHSHDRHSVGVGARSLIARQAPGNTAGVPRNVSGLKPAELAICDVGCDAFGRSGAHPRRTADAMAPRI